MKNALLKLSVGTSTAIGGVLLWMGVSYADPVTPETLATSAGTSFRDTGIAVIAVLIPFAIALLLAKKALPWARRMLHV
jgi:hypothetical protein